MEGHMRVNFCKVRKEQFFDVFLENVSPVIKVALRSIVQQDTTTDALFFLKYGQADYE